MSLVVKYKLFWAACIATLCGLAFWKNSKSYPGKSRLWRLGKSAIDTGLVLLMVVYAPALLSHVRGDLADQPLQEQDHAITRPSLPSWPSPSGRSRLRSCRRAGCVRRGPADRPGCGPDGQA